MNANPKIQPQHLERQAYVYIRQSTMKQVEHNLSHDLQYQLAQQGLGCPVVAVIDDDLEIRHQRQRPPGSPGQRSGAGESGAYFSHRCFFPYATAPTGTSYRIWLRYAAR
jgi:hypothetical protein